MPEIEIESIISPKMILILSMVVIESKETAK